MAPYNKRRNSMINIDIKEINPFSVATDFSGKRAAINCDSPNAILRNCMSYVVVTDSNVKFNLIDEIFINPKKVSA